MRRRFETAFGGIDRRGREARVGPLRVALDEFGFVLEGEANVVFGAALEVGRVFFDFGRGSDACTAR